MNKGTLFLAAAMALSTFAADPQPLKVRLVCYSILFRPAALQGTGFSYTHQVTSQGRFFKPYNGELAFAPPEIPTSHFGAFIITDNLAFEDEDIPFNVQVNVPGSDLNQNFVPDIVEFSRGASGTTIGDYEDINGDVGTFSAQWSKSANSHTGTCRIIYDFTNPSAFQHTIEILNYEGNLSSVVKEGTTVRAQATLARLGVPAETLTGQITFSVANGVVKLTSTSLTHSSGNPFAWTNAGDLERDRTEFFQDLTVTDGTPEEAFFVDFHDWLFSLFDPNDFDADGIPDLIDPPSANPTAPELKIIKTQNGIQLQIHGDIGRTYTLEDASALTTPMQWLHPTSVMLSADPHLIDIASPSSPTFWRMRYP
jgi:hypothetical protein